MARGIRKGIVTEYRNICFFCGREAEAEHHLLFGSRIRHTMGSIAERIHGNAMAEKLSKMLGQAMYEIKIGTREEFRQRYGKSYL